MIYKTALSFIRKTAVALILVFLAFFSLIAGAQNIYSPGMTPEQLHKLFTPAVDNNAYGTGGERDTGLGLLLLCYEFVKANNGTITVTSEPGKGSRFVVALPLG